MGIPRNKEIGKNTDATKKDSTALQGLQQNSALGIIDLHQKCNCDLKITGGTEKGVHDTSFPENHETGHKVDFKRTSSLNAYVVKNLNLIGQGKYGYRYSENQNIYSDEIGNTKGGSHWDIKFKENFNYKKPKKENL